MLAIKYMLILCESYSKFYEGESFNEMKNLGTDSIN